MNEPRVLFAADIVSPTWKRMRRHLLEQQESGRIRLEQNLDPVETAALRGELRCIRNLLTLENQDPAVVVADDEQE